MLQPRTSRSYRNPSTSSIFRGTATALTIGCDPWELLGATKIVLGPSHGAWAQNGPSSHHAYKQHDKSCYHMSESLHPQRLVYHRVCGGKKPSSMPKSLQPLNLTVTMSNTRSLQRGLHLAAGHPNDCKHHSYATLKAGRRGFRLGAACVWSSYCTSQRRGQDEVCWLRTNEPSPGSKLGMASFGPNEATQLPPELACRTEMATKRLG